MPRLLALIRVAFRSLLRPGPPPVGWAKLAAWTLAALVALDLALVALGIALHENPGRYFGEGRPGTVLSTLMFLWAGVLAIALSRELTLRRVARAWLVAGIGFLWLAVDEMFKGHENLDVWLNRLFGLDPENPVADRLDEIIVAAYPLIALAIAWPRRLELLRLRWMLVCWGAAFVAFVVMAFYDATGWSSAIEESAKLFAAGLLALGVASARMLYGQRAEHAARAGVPEDQASMRDGPVRRRVRERLVRRGSPGA